MFLFLFKKTFSIIQYHPIHQGFTIGMHQPPAPTLKIWFPHLHPASQSASSWQNFPVGPGGKGGGIGGSLGNCFGMQDG